LKHVPFPIFAISIPPAPILLTNQRSIVKQKVRHGAV